MQTRFGHLLFLVDLANLPFYREVLTYLGWAPLYDDPEMLGMGAGDASVWFGEPMSAAKNDHDAPGLNHFAIAAESVADVDATAAYLAGRGVAALFETPRHRPEFASGPDDTYYQVMFESPDRILFEVVYTGPK